MNVNRHKVVILLSIILITIAFAGSNSSESLLPRLTPVPAMIVGVDRDVVSLDGQWIFNQAPNKDRLDE